MSIQVHTYTGEVIASGKGFKFTGYGSGNQWEVTAAGSGPVHGIATGQIDEFSNYEAVFLVNGPCQVLLSQNVSAGDQLALSSTGFKKREESDPLVGEALFSGTSGSTTVAVLHGLDTPFNMTSLASGDILVKAASGWQRVPVGTSDQVLTGGSTPTYGSVPSGALTSVPSASLTGTVTESKGGLGMDASGLSNGLLTRLGSGSWTTRTITAGTGISISNGNGVSGNPTISSSSGGILQSVTSRVSSDQTTTSSSLVDISGASVTLTTSSGSKLLINVSFSMSNASALGSTNRIALLIDGSVEANSGFTTPLISNVVQGGGFTVLKSGLSAASHTIKLQWSNTTGTTQCRPVGTTTESAIITVAEITA